MAPAAPISTGTGTIRIGIAEGIAKLSGFMLEAWNRIRFARAEKTKTSIKTASEGLSLLSELKQAEEKKAISSEEAEKLRRTIFRSIDSLFDSGVYISEMETVNLPTLKTLPYERKKLLTYIPHEGRESRAPSPRRRPAPRQPNLERYEDRRESDSDPER